MREKTLWILMRERRWLVWKRGEVEGRDITAILLLLLLAVSASNSLEKKVVLCHVHN